MIYDIRYMIYDLLYIIYCIIIYDILSYAGQRCPDGLSGASEHLSRARCLEFCVLNGTLKTRPRRLGACTEPLSACPGPLNVCHGL